MVSDWTIRNRVRHWSALGLAQELHRIALIAYDKMIGLGLSELSVDGCQAKAPCRGDKAWPSPVDRAKQGLKRLTLVDSGGIPIGLGSAGEPTRLRLRGQHVEPSRDIVRRCLAAALPAAWVTADEAYGQDWSFRRLLEQLDVGYVVAVPKSQQIKSLAGIWRIDQLIEEAPPTPGRPSPAATEPRARASTTGQRPNCPPTSSSTRTHPFITAG